MLNKINKKAVCLFLILCLSSGLITGCRNNNAVDNAENTSNTEDDAVMMDNTGITDNDSPDVDTEDTEDTDVSDVSTEDQAENIQGFDILHPVIATKEIYSPKPGGPDESGPLLEVKWNTISLSDEEALKYPRLAKSLNLYSKEQDKTANGFYDESIDETYSYLNSEEEELAANGQVTDDWYNNMSEWPMFLTFEHQNFLNITRCDDIAFTIQEDYYVYSGGAHGYYAYSGKNFDTQTGHELMVEDVVNDINRLNDILYEKLMTEYADLMLEEKTVKDDLKSRASGEYNYDWLLSHDKVTFYFNPYALTAYAGGMQVIDIFFSEYPDLFEEKYTTAPDEYVLHFGKNGGANLDIDGDGDIEKISVYVNEDYESYPEETDKGSCTISITIDDETDSYSMPEGYDGDIYFVHAKCGNYIYFCSKVYDVQYVMCIDISAEPEKRVCGQCEFQPYIIDIKNDGVDLQYGINRSSTEIYTEAFTDLSNFALSYGEKRLLYYVGNDGMPAGGNP